MVTELDIARQGRTNCKTRLTKFNTFLTKCLDPNQLIEIDEIKLRLKKIEDCWVEYDKFQTNLEILAPTPSRETERVDFEEEYFKLVMIANKLINKNISNDQQIPNINDEEVLQYRSRIAQLEADLLAQRQAEIENLRGIAGSRALTPATEISSSSRVHFPLPKLDLPTFAGNYDEWLGFKDAFEAIIHIDSSIPTIQKLRYLRSYIRGNAAQVIDNLQTTEANYEVAWQLLKERYDNHRIIKQNHMQGILELSTLSSKDSFSGLRKLLDTVLRHVRALNVLGEPTSQWDTPLICIIVTKLDKETRREWEGSIKGNEMPKFEALTKFMREKCQILESIKCDTDQNKYNLRSNNKAVANYDKPYTGKTFVNVHPYNKCINCEGDHTIRQCDHFFKLPVTERIQIIKKRGLCYNCLGGNHLISECRSGNCNKCNRRHHTLLHLEAKGTSTPNLNKENVHIVSQKNLHLRYSSEVLLSTAIIDIVDCRGREHACRVLLDSGSQPNLITEEFANRLNLKRRKLESSVEVINNKQISSSEWVVAKIKSKISNYNVDLDFLIFPQITGDVPTNPIKRDILGIPDNVRLADPHFDEPGRVEALIGGELFYDLLLSEKIQLTLPRTALQKSYLGWIVTGKVNNAWNQQRLKSNVIQDSLGIQLEKFWELENLDERRHLSVEEEECERHFELNIKRNETGRYMARLPFNDKLRDLGSSYDLARKRFFALERRLDKDGDMREQYNSFMKEYEELQHMEPLPYVNKHDYYIPHHAVIKETSLTTKLRVVFDASAKSTTGLSLNDVMRVGPTIQDGIFELLLRFRQHIFVISSDIEKMYRQFLIDPEDCQYQNILWRANNKEPLKAYRLKTVTYGTASAPFLATRCLKQLAMDESRDFPESAEILQRDLYVDDLLTGGDSLEAVMKVRNDLVTLAGRGGLRLCKWASNDARLLQGLPDCSKATRQQLCQDQVTKTLGVAWNSLEDVLQFDINISSVNDSITKRTILAQTARLYDPLGLLAPIIMFAKILLQDLWKLNLGWDDHIPDELAVKWQDYLGQLELVAGWRIPRSVKIIYSKELHLHGFADASEQAYGACLYVRSSNNEGNSSTLLCSKSRVAPVKTVSLPRLELCGAVLLTRLFKKVILALKLNFNKVIFWSDSTIALNWIKTSPHCLNTFVANRVSEIQSLDPAPEWRHISTDSNPADLMTRKRSPRQLVDNELWKHGPEWLIAEESTWPKSIIESVEIPERKKVTLLITTRIDRSDLWKRFSSFFRLTRFVSLCLKFIRRWRKQPVNLDSTVKEHRDAQARIIQLIQHDEFHNEIKALNDCRDLPATSKILTLHPFMEDDILRVGGRIRKADIGYDQRHPILLPKSHPITELIVRETHERTMHSGPNATLYSIRQRYWVIDGRSVVRKAIHACVKCFRVKPREPLYVMGDLPKSRVTASYPFERVGVDYCGYFYIKEKRHRNRNKVKVYAAIFVCLTTKAVHVELVADLTTEAFLGALRRFFSRRGKSRILYSDNGTNFLGADRQLKELHSLINSESHNNKIKNHLADHEIEWNFIPPRTPHFGGIWEAAVKSLKHHMRRTVGETLFTFEDLSTYMCEIEAVLNSRPLTPMSCEPDDLRALTPGHFLIGRPLTALPCEDFSNVTTNRLAVWQHIQKLKCDLWKRWSHEYLSEMNVRSKWSKGSSDLVRVGSLVVLREDNLPPLRWSLGRIVEVYPGDDGVIRVVSLKTEKGVFKRGVKKISPLPIDT